MTSSEIYQSKSSDSSVSFESSSGSRSLRERRARQIEQERKIRSRMSRIGTPDSTAGVSLASSGSHDGSVESSLISLNMNRSSKEKDFKKEIRWEKVLVEFTFGLLTTRSEAPRRGHYHSKRSSRRSDDSISTKSSSKLLDRTPILKHIMAKAGELSKAAVKNRSGNVIIKAKTPHVESVIRDGE